MTDLVGMGQLEEGSSFLTAVRSHTLSRLDALLIAAGAAVWAAALGGLAVWRHGEFLSHRADLGAMVQAVWSTSQGRPLEVTDLATGEQVTRLAGHVDPILVLYAPLWWLHPSPGTLIVAQAAAFAAGVYPVVRLGLKYPESRLAAGLLGAWYLTLPWVVWMTFNELNPLSLALPLLLYTIWFLDHHRLGPFCLFAALAVLTGELVGLAIAGLGVWYAIRYRRVRTGVAVAVAGVAWTTICLNVVIPAFNDGRSSRFYGHFESVGGSPTGLLRTLLTDPGAVLAQVATGGDLQYVLWLLLPTALLFLGQPLLLLLAVPQLGVNLLSEFPSTVSPLYHYSAPIVAALVGATIMGVGRLPGRLRVPAAGGLVFLSVVVLGSIPPVPGQEQYLFPSRDTAARTAAMRQAVELVPPGVPVTATNRLGAHLSARRVVQAFPQKGHADWAAVDTQDPWSRYADPEGLVIFRALVERFDRNPSWEKVFEDEGIRVYRRRA